LAQALAATRMASVACMDVRVLRSIPTPVADALVARGCQGIGDVLARPDMLHQSLASLEVPNPEKRASELHATCRHEAKEVGDVWASAASALSLLQQRPPRPPLQLPCTALTALLGGALRLGSGGLLEICGVPGTGKTQLCLQMCAAAQIQPPDISVYGDGPGISGAVFIDAEGSFIPKRYAQICGALLAERLSGAGEPALEEVMRKMHVCRTYDATELYATVKQLCGFLRSHPYVRALVVDSLAFSFRHEFSDNQPQRARVLMDIATTLRRYSTEHGLVVAVTNHMTTRFDHGGLGGESGFLVPALGETWAHQPSTQVRLERLAEGAPARAARAAASAPIVPGVATLTKSVERAVGQSCEFCIAEGGVRDLDGCGGGMPAPLAARAA